MRLFLIIFALAVFSIAKADDVNDELEHLKTKWRKSFPQYTPGASVPPATFFPSPTRRYEKERPRIDVDPLVGEFLARGYFALDALEKDRKIALLNDAEIIKFHEALRVTAVEFVDEQLFDNEQKRVGAVTEPNPDEPALKRIRVNRQDWIEGKRGNPDLLRLVLHEYLRVIGKFDDNYVLSVRLLTTEEDFQKQRIDFPQCISGKTARAHILLNVAAETDLPVYVNGEVIPDNTAFRQVATPPLCTSRSHPFRLKLGAYTQTVFLYGGDEIMIRLPSGEEFYRSYSPLPALPGVTPFSSPTQRYSIDRIGVDRDPISGEFLARGYFALASVKKGRKNEILTSSEAL